MALSGSNGGGNSSLVGLSPQEINAIAGRDIESGNLGISALSHAADIENKRNALVADTTNKARINEINEFKAYWESQAKIAEANKDVALMNKANGELSKIPAEIAKLKSGTAQDYAAAGASGREMKVGLNPKSGKYEYVNVANGKFTGVEASPKDINNSDGNRPWNSGAAVAGYVGELTKWTDSKGKVRLHTGKIDSIRFDVAKEQVAAEGKILNKTSVYTNDGTFEVPIILKPGESKQLTASKLISAIMDAYNKSEEEATDWYREHQANIKSKGNTK